jgi:hypothetical protein
MIVHGFHLNRVVIGMSISTIRRHRIDRFLAFYSVTIVGKQSHSGMNMFQRYVFDIIHTSCCFSAGQLYDNDILTDRHDNTQRINSVQNNHWRCCILSNADDSTRWHICISVV